MKRTIIVQKTLKERVYDLLDAEPMTTEELSNRLFKATDAFSQQKVRSVFSALRKLGVDLYPEQAECGKPWRLKPRNEQEARDYMGWKAKMSLTQTRRMCAGFARMAKEYPSLRAEKNKLKTRIDNYLTGNAEEENGAEFSHQIRRI